MEKIHWGIIGCGKIAVSFARDLELLPEAKLLAVASRSKERAEELGRMFSVERRYDNYAALACDPSVDVVYVATRHHDHHDATRLCLESGKAVLVEKPFCLNAPETEKLINLARERDLFLMEAMWTRFLPVIQIIRDRILSGEIGKVKWLFADFGFRAPYDPEGRVFNPMLAGGALLDVGIYPVSFASMVFGAQPGELEAQAYIGETGIDESTSCLFRYPLDGMAVLACSVTSLTMQQAFITGETGSFSIPRFWKARDASLIRNGETVETITPGLKGVGYNYEAEEVMGCLRNGQKESRYMPLDESLAIMQTLDRIRNRISLRYPHEE